MTLRTAYRSLLVAAVAVSLAAGAARADSKRRHHDKGKGDKGGMAPVGDKPKSDPKALNSLTMACSTPNADVFVDGEKIGQAPIELPLPVANGSHTIKVVKLGFAPYIDVFTAKPGTPVKLEVELVPITGVLKVTSKLKEARVLVDGKYVGDAPVEVEIDVGPRAIQISKAGYKELFKNVMAVAGQTNEIEANLEELPPELNPYIVKPLPPPKWYQKKWTWGVIVPVVVVAVAGVIIGGVVGAMPRDPLAGVDTLYTVGALRF